MTVLMNHMEVVTSPNHSDMETSSMLGFVEDLSETFHSSIHEIDQDFLLEEFWDFSLMPSPFPQNESIPQTIEYSENADKY